MSLGADHQGLIEIIGIDDNVCILCNEEGKIIGLEPNRKFYNDILCGVFYVTGEDDDGNLASLSSDMQEKASLAVSLFAGKNIDRISTYKNKRCILGLLPAILQRYLYYFYTQLTELTESAV